MNRIKILFSALQGEWTKYTGHLTPLRIKNIIIKRKTGRQVIVSLTSYGHRAKKIVDTTIVSLLKQSYKPDRIILWLDSDNWNEDNLPPRLKQLKKHGVEIRFSEDIKSYKKLIPTLDIAGEDDYIITVDDDQYYPRDFVKGLVEAMDRDPNSIHAYQAHKVRFDENHNLLPYNQWELCTDDLKEGLFFPTGVGGIIYKKSLLHEDIAKKDLFMNLAPKADDIWFFIMALLKGVKCKPIKPTQPLLPIDLFYQKMHSNSSLRDSNWGEEMNDKQLRAVMNHYKITDQDLQTFSSI